MPVRVSLYSQGNGGDLRRREQGRAAELTTDPMSTAGATLIHYQKSNGVVALVVAEDSAGRRMPFAFLAELHKRVRPL